VAREHLRRPGCRRRPVEGKPAVFQDQDAIGRSVDAWSDFLQTLFRLG